MLHEAVPGHHFQVSRAQEQSKCRSSAASAATAPSSRAGGSTPSPSARSWGSIRDPYTKFGELASEMLRAVRLVVDTGLHAKGWTREQAIDYFQENSGETDHDIAVEVDRYIVRPGQALATRSGS